MPIYEYRCEACGHEVEALQKISDAPLRECPACHEALLQRLVSAPAFRLKGGGWYETDFKSDKEKKRNLAESGDAPKTGAKAADGGKAPAGDSKPKETKPAKTESAKPAKAEGGAKAGAGV